MSLPPIVEYESHTVGEIDSGDSMTETSVDIPAVENCDTATVNVNDSVIETVDEPTAAENRVEVRRSQREQKQLSILMVLKLICHPPLHHPSLLLHRLTQCTFVGRV
ncbi:hypothetical protein CCACVL1_07662 [Corchorus capsularis]|uniref:Uncharacterized protein n=1 Tax=Corchorus capsularis TaxID=210143 RepID=A0A1R3J4J2_COCAP|nr:hypothetical protein CCACVL1_07662 [Corchorus capsularis]